MEDLVPKTSDADRDPDRKLIELWFNIGPVEAAQVQRILRTMQPQETSVLRQISRVLVVGGLGFLHGTPKQRINDVFKLAQHIPSTDVFPNELLVLIFDEIKAVSEGQQILAVSQVCQRWRSIAISTPHLWTTVLISACHSLPISWLFIHRSGHHLVDVIIDYLHLKESPERQTYDTSELDHDWLASSQTRVERFPPHHPHFDSPTRSTIEWQEKRRVDAMAKIALSCVDRWSTLIIKGANDRFLASYATASAPFLRRLSIIGDSPGGNRVELELRPPVLFPWDLIRIAPVDIRIPFAPLTYLALNVRLGCYAALCRLLSNLPSLSYLDFQSSPFYWSSTDSLQEIVISNLHTLNMEGCDYIGVEILATLKTISSPVLETLRIHVRPCLSNLTDFLCRDRIRFPQLYIPTPHSSVCTLSINLPLSFKEASPMIWLSRTLPNLTSLTVPCDSLIWRALLISIIPLEDFRNPPLRNVPHLTGRYIHYDGISDRGPYVFNWAQQMVRMQGKTQLVWPHLQSLTIREPPSILCYLNMMLKGRREAGALVRNVVLQGCDRVPGFQEMVRNVMAENVDTFLVVESNSKI